MSEPTDQSSFAKPPLPFGNAQKLPPPERMPLRDKLWLSLIPGLPILMIAVVFVATNFGDGSPQLLIINRSTTPVTGVILPGNKRFVAPANSFTHVADPREKFTMRIEMVKNGRTTQVTLLSSQLKPQDLGQFPEHRAVWVP